MPRFDRDVFVGDCLAARAETEPVEALRAVVERAVSDPVGLNDFIRVPLDPDDDDRIWYRSESLFIGVAVFPCGFRTGIHNHGVSAVIGACAGHEDNWLYRRTQLGIESSGHQRLGVGDVMVLDADAIHDVHAPTDRWTAALHVYPSDLLALKRSSWLGADAPESEFDGAEFEHRWTQIGEATGLLGRR